METKNSTHVSLFVMVCLPVLSRCVLLHRSFKLQASIFFFFFFFESEFVFRCAYNLAQRRSRV